MKKTYYEECEHCSGIEREEVLKMIKEIDKLPNDEITIEEYSKYFNIES